MYMNLIISFQVLIAIRNTKHVLLESERLNLEQQVLRYLIEKDQHFFIRSHKKNESNVQGKGFKAKRSKIAASLSPPQTTIARPRHC